MANNTNLNTNSIPIPPASGGTGVANTGTITVGGNTSFSGAFTFAGTVTGNTSITFPTSGTLATTSGASGIVNSGTANQLGYYAGTGTTISGLTSGNNSILVTDGSGVPSISGTLPFTVPVTTGGTGVATMTTAYAPVCAGTTATGALQVASTGLSTSGYVLTSNGASAVPSFQATSAPSGVPITVSVTMTGSQFQNMYTTPIQIVAAPAAGSMHVVQSLEWMYVYGSSPFVITTSTNVVLQWGNAAAGAGTATMSAVSPNNFGGSAKVMNRAIPVVHNALAKASFDGLGLYASNQTAIFNSAGTGNSVIVIVTYITVATGL